MEKQLVRFSTGKPVVKEAADGKRTALFVISDETQDRHDTVIPIKGWELDNFHGNPVVFFNHNWFSSEPDNLIGKGRVFIKGKKLMGEVEFEPAEINELADKVFKKLQFGTLNATSVSFIPLEEGEFKKLKQKNGEKKKIFHFGTRDLLEFSVVNIPSNPSALKKFYKEQEEMIAKLNEGEDEAPETPAEETPSGDETPAEEPTSTEEDGGGEGTEEGEEGNSKKSLSYWKRKLSLHEHC